MNGAQIALAAALEEALLAARDRLGSLDAETEAQLTVLFEAAADRISARLQDAAGPDGFLPAAELQALLGALGLELAQLATAQEQLALSALQEAADSGAQVATSLRQRIPAGGEGAERIAAVPDARQIASDALQDVISQIMEDGLQLSDRLWRNHLATRQTLELELVRAVTAGETAREATRQALLRAQVADAATLNQIELSRADALGDRMRGMLSPADSAAYGNALRVFRTEINRANLAATRKTIYAVRGVVGTRFLLSPLHPRFDVCDVHAGVNLYGLGAGVYPPGRSPLPAHPNTLSYEEVVFEWEIAAGDREGQEDLLGYLMARNPDQQLAVLQSQDKVRELRAGRLQPEDVFRPWREISQKYAA